MKVAQSNLLYCYYTASHTHSCRPLATSTQDFHDHRCNERFLVVIDRQEEVNLLLGRPFLDHEHEHILQILM